MMQDSPFADLIPGAPPQAAPLTPIIPRRPAPVRPEQERNETLSGNRTDQQIRQDDTRGVNFQDEESLRDSYQANPAVRNYETIMPLFASASQAEDGGAGDLNIIYAFGKAMDPGSVVREGELQMTQNTGGMQEQLNGWIQSLRTPGGRLPAGVRQRLLTEIRSRASATGDAYRQVRADYRARAERYGFDPNAIMGQNAGQPFQQAEADFLDRPVRNMDGSQGPPPRGSQPPVNPLAAPEGTHAEFGSPDPLRDLGIAPEQAENWTPEQAALYDAFMTANPEATAEQIRLFGRNSGLGDIENAEDIARARAGGFQSGSTARRARPDISGERGNAAPLSPLGMSGALGATTETIPAAVRGARDVVTLGYGDELTAASNSLSGLGSYDDNLRFERGVDEYDEQNNWGARLFGQGAGALAIPTGVPRAGFRAMLAARGSPRIDVIRAGTRGAARRLGTESAVFGGAYGTGSGEGDLDERLAGGGISALFGGTAGYGLGRGMGAVVNRYGRRDPSSGAADQLRAARSAHELDIYMPRSVIGGEQAQRWATTVEKTPFGAAPVARGTERMIDTSRVARDRIATGAGEVLEPEALGDTAIRGGEAMRSRTSAAADRLYGNAERWTGETRVPLTGAAAELDGQIAELADTPGVAPDILSTLESIRSRIDGDWTPASIRRMKTELERQFGSAGMRPGDASRRARRITEAAEEDMVTGLRNAGQGDAAQAWRAAADDWRERQTMLERVIEPILGRNNDRTPEEVTRALLANAKGNGTRLGAFIREIPSEEAGSIRASIINQLGRSPSGSQDAAGEAFSLDTFLTHWDQIKGARHQIFDRPTLQALNHLANVAERAKGAGRARNLSNTGTPMMATVTASPLVAGATALAMGSPKAALAATLMSGFAAVAQNRAGALLASPTFARRLANTPADPVSARRFWSGPWVVDLARTQPTIANDLFGFQQAVLRGLGGDMSRAAADSGGEEQ